MGVLPEPGGMDNAKTISWLRGQVVKLEVSSSTGVIQQQQVDWLVSKGCKHVERLCRNTPLRYTDVVWGGLAVLICDGEIAESFCRKKTGGMGMSDWKELAMVAGGWKVASGSLTLDFERWKTEVVAAVTRVPGAFMECDAVVIPAGGLTNAYHRVRRLWGRDDKADIFHCCVADLALEGRVLGDVSRRRPGGAVNKEWWRGTIGMLVSEGVLTHQIGAQITIFLEKGLISSIKPVQVEQSSSEKAWWVVDLCCGSKSRAPAVKEEMLENWGIEIEYIGVDIAPVFWDGTMHIVPEWIVDVMDEVSFPKFECAAAVAKEFGLCMNKLIHVFISTPCATNSRADMSNRNKGFGYRDWRQQECPPLPVGLAVDGIIPHGFTSQKHHDLAVAHDLLEQKVIIGVAVEAQTKGFSFSAENPRAGLARKRWMQRFKYAPLRVVEVHHCAYGGVYRKPTHYFTNLAEWVPTGWSGSGKCGGRGSKCVKRCREGCVIDKRFKHYHTIARESAKEFSSEKVSRKMAKNALPAMQTKEIVGSAWRNVVKANTVAL